MYNQLLFNISPKMKLWRSKTEKKERRILSSQQVLLDHE